MAEERETNQQPAQKGESFVGMLVSAGVGLLLAGAAVLMIRHRLWWPVYALWGAGSAALIASAALRPRQIIAVLTGRGVRYGSNTALLIVLVIAIAVLANYLAGRHHKRFDLTRTQVNTLSPQTKKILRGLKQPVKIFAFYSQTAGGYQEMQDLLQEYQYGSREVKAQMVDPEANPGLARQYGVTSYPTTIVEAGNQREELYAASEQEITRTLLKLTQAKRKKVYFVQGHGEHDIDSGEPDGYSTIKGALTALNYAVEKLMLPGKAQIPADCDALVIAGPKTPFDPRETAAVQVYLNSGGKALIMVDPDAQGISLAELLEPWGLKPLPYVVVEPNFNFFGDASSVTVIDFAYHDITRPFIRGRALIPVFVLVRAFERTETTEPQLSVQDLLRTSGESWLETNFKGTINRSSAEKRGPFTIGAVVTRGASPEPSDEGSRQARTRMVVFGDSDFAANGIVANGVNKDLFVNSVGWLAESEELISIQPKEPERSPVLLTALQQRIVFFLCLIAVPLASIVVGAVVWWRRR